MNKSYGLWDVSRSCGCNCQDVSILIKGTSSSIHPIFLLDRKQMYDWSFSSHFRLCGNLENGNHALWCNKMEGLWPVRLQTNPYKLSTVLLKWKRNKILSFWASYFEFFYDLQPSLILTNKARKDLCILTTNTTTPTQKWKLSAERRAKYTYTVVWYPPLSLPRLGCLPADMLTFTIFLWECVCVCGVCLKHSIQTCCLFNSICLWLISDTKGNFKKTKKGHISSRLHMLSPGLIFSFSIIILFLLFVVLLQSKHFQPSLFATSDPQHIYILVWYLVLWKYIFRKVNFILPFWGKKTICRSTSHRV